MQRALLILLFAASYVLFAGVPAWTLAPLLGLAALAALVAPARTFAWPRATRWFDLALLALLAAAAIQVIPLPSRIVAMLSPHASAIIAAVQLTPVGLPAPAWRTLSVHPSESLAALGTLALGAASFWIARSVFNAGGGTRLCLKALTFLGTLAAALAIVQKAAAPRSILFMVTPEARNASPFGAFVNRNHFAAWLLMIVAPVVGYAIARLHTHDRQGRWRESFGEMMASGVAFSFLGIITMVGVMLLTLSRSGLAGLAAAALVGWILGQPRVRLSRSNLPALLGGIGVAAMVAFLFVDVDRWAERFEQTFNGAADPFSRTTIWRESLPIAKDFWAVGTGAGTFSDAMTVYQQTRFWVGAMQNWAHFNNAHSLYVQVAVEGGLLLVLPFLAALIALAVLGLNAIRADKGEMFWVRVGAAAGLAGVAAQSLWEVAPVVPANAVLAGMLAGLLLYQREPIVRARQPRREQFDVRPARMAR